MPGLVPPVADEREGLLGFLRQQRDAVRIATYGLTDEQARATPAASALSLGGIVKHLTDVERGWMQLVVDGRDADSSVDDYLEGFTMRADETLPGLLADYDAVAANTDKVVADIADLGRPVPVPRNRPWFPPDLDAWSVRWVLLHLIEETAKHAGHADIIRESLDGATFYPLMAAAEGRPETAWLKPWQPAS